VALEAKTGWRFIVEELIAAGAIAHLAEPETANLRGRKARAKTDRTDARHLRECAAAGSAAGDAGAARGDPRAAPAGATPKGPD
jgi:hypothetical protein